MPPGGGFGVDTSTLEVAASRARSLGAQFSSLRSAIDAALRTAQPVGLGVGSALTLMSSEWDALLDHVAVRVGAAGTTLASNAAAYGEADSRMASAMNRVGG
jgi:hypothetical protein